jgi:hypothetical protein
MNESRRCTAHSSQTGERCKRSAIKGGTVCASHGGRAPQVKKSAKERLAELIEPALAGLHKALQSNDLGSIVKASQIVLDRTGFHPTKSVELFGKDGGPIETTHTTIDPESLTPEARESLLGIITQMAQKQISTGSDSPPTNGATVEVVSEAEASIA